MSGKTINSFGQVNYLTNDQEWFISEEWAASVAAERIQAALQAITYKACHLTPTWLDCYMWECSCGAMGMHPNHALPLEHAKARWQ